MAGCIALSVNAQSDYNKWSLELNGGFNHAQAPLTPNYFSPISLGHVDFGVRYMFNDKFGAKLDYGLGSFSESSGTPAFSTNYYRLNLQGVANLGRIMKWESFDFQPVSSFRWRYRTGDRCQSIDDNVYNLMIVLWSN